MHGYENETKQGHRLRKEQERHEIRDVGSRSFSASMCLVFWVVLHYLSFAVARSL